MVRFRTTCKAERAAQIELGKLLTMARAGRQPDSDVTVALMCVPLPLAGLFRVTLQEVEVQASEEQRTCGEQPGGERQEAAPHVIPAPSRAAVPGLSRCRGTRVGPLPARTAPRRLSDRAALGKSVAPGARTTDGQTSGRPKRTDGSD